MATPAYGRQIKRADPSSIQNKFLVGYQGWFTCPGDGAPLDPNHHGWLHWFGHPLPDGGRPNFDFWPDTSEYSPSELYPATGLKYNDGQQAFLFSSRNPRTVERHFHWMAMHGVDGAFLQRFLGQCDLERGNKPIRDQRDEVGEYVRQAAEKEGRVFSIMYDLAGVPPDRIELIIKQDWIHLIRDQKVLDSPSYLREKGKPVVTIWGFGMDGAHHHPDIARRVTAFIRDNTPGGAYIMAGCPAYWRTAESDADRDPAWLDVWLNDFDALSPWTIGRYEDIEGVDRFAKWNVEMDWKMLQTRNEEFERGVAGRTRHIDYLPVVFPGGSGFHMSSGQFAVNNIRRLGGQFFWRQLWNIRRLGIHSIYGAMWDEYDEGTAYLPIVSKQSQVPVHDKFKFIALDIDKDLPEGRNWDNLPSDWYMRCAGLGAEALHGERQVHETFPSKELQDYWSTRPHYEEKDSAHASGSGPGAGQSWDEWQKLEKEKEELGPPPAYTLVADEPSSSAPHRSPETRPIPPTGTAAAGTTSTETGALNAASHPSTVRPAILLASRPSLSRPVAQPTAPSAPPPIPLLSRPSLSANTRPEHNRPPQPSVSSVTEDFERHNISTAELQDLQSGCPSAPHPTPPPPRPESSQRPPFPGHSSPPFGQSTLSYGPPPSGSSSFPMPGFNRPASPPGSWSQTPWPPPEWGVQPSSPTAHSTFPGYNYDSTYNPSYLSGYPASSPPPMPSHSSVSVPYRVRPPHSHSSSQSPSPTPSPSSNSYDIHESQPGGFYFPQPTASHGPGQPQPHATPAPYAPYGRTSPPHFPTESAYSGYGTSSPPPPSGPYGGPPPPPSRPSNSSPPLPPRPGLGRGNSYTTYSSSSSYRPSQTPTSNSGLLGAIGGLPGGGMIQGLAQTGLSTGEKLFNKLRK